MLKPAFIDSLSSTSSCTTRKRVNNKRQPTEDKRLRNQARLEWGRSHWLQGMDRPTDREDFKAFVAWWYNGEIPDSIPIDVKNALDTNQPEALNQPSIIWTAWLQHRFFQNPNSLIHQSSREQTYVGPRGGIYKMTASGRRYI